jgi:hypothetical protein
MLGICAAAALTVAARPAGGHGEALPASLSLAALQDGAVEVSPAAPAAVLRSPRLRPGGHASGVLRLRNQTGTELQLGLRGRPSSTALDGLVRVQVIAGHRELSNTTLQGLRKGTEASIPLAPRESARLRVRAWLPASIETGYEGREVKVMLQPVVTTADGG